jgi:hypothetical protein
MKKQTLAVLLAYMFCAGMSAQSLQSPDGKFEMNFQLKQGIPYYNLKYKGNTVVEDSKLGLRLFKDVSVPFAAEIAGRETEKMTLTMVLLKPASNKVPKMKPGSPCWERRKTISITIMN